MRLWRPVSETVWQGRDDSAEASNAKRIFQTIQQQGSSRRFHPALR
jgi:formiminoglutamase